MSSSGLLALVQPDLPRSPQRLRELQVSKPRLAEQVNRLGELCRTLSGMPSREQGNAFVRSVLTTPNTENGNGGTYERFAQRVAEIRRAQEDLSRSYMPDSYVEKLFGTDYPDQVTTDPVTLLLTGFQPMPEAWKPSEVDRRISFEARRNLVLALLHWDLAYTKRIGKQYTKEDRSELTEFLLEREIITGLTIPTDVLSLHDPRNAMRTRWVEHFHETSAKPSSTEMSERSTRFYMSELRLDDGRVIPVAVEVRRKRFLQIVGKMLAVRGAGVQDVADRRGLRFLYATVDDMQAGAAFIRKHLPLTDFMTSDEAYRDTTVPEAPLLPFVKANLPMISYFRSLAGHRVQMQHFTAAHHLDLRHSRGPENHALYNLRKYTYEYAPPRRSPPGSPGSAPEIPLETSESAAIGLFYWEYPEKIYGVKWNDPNMSEEFVHHILASLPT